ncbi:MAG: glycosyltransferase family 9 protein [Bacteroidales bacterium]|nr:glycosyltransferase family 9 protein [Bacteroidales bacterium]
MKILVIRLGSLGDVVLATPVLRCLKQQIDGGEIHFLTKKNSADLMSNNANIDNLHVLRPTLDDTIDELRQEHFDCIVDLHNNHRSRRIRHSLHIKSYVYKKENFGKFMLVLFKCDIMSGRHVVDRYMDAIKPLGVKPDGKGLELHLPAELDSVYRTDKPFVAIACGAQHETKRIPIDKIRYLAEHINSPVVLLGDKDDLRRMEEKDSVFPGNTTNLCGKTSLLESADIVQRSSVVITSDSALMHVASAFHRPVVALWGCTSPRFGFEAYHTEHFNYTPTSLRCWPCRRMGSEKCPKKHFLCMLSHDYDAIAERVNAIVSTNN